MKKKTGISTIGLSEMQLHEHQLYNLGNQNVENPYLNEQPRKFESVKVRESLVKQC